MAEFYNNFASLAGRLIKQRGQQVTFTRSSGSNPITGAGGTQSSFTGFGLVFDYESRLVDGVQIIAQDKRLLLEPDLGGNTPAVNDDVTIQGVAYKAMNVSPLSPAGTVVKYDVQLRS